MQYLLEKIAFVIADWVKNKKTGSVVFEINFTQGGIGNSNVTVKNKL